MKRVFVVGCPRSGTTLVQSIVGKHSGFVSFPESNVFPHTLVDMRLRRYGHHVGLALPILWGGGMLAQLGFSLPRFRNRVFQFLEEASLENEKKRFNKLPKNRTLPILSAFIDVLNDHAGCDGWVEKTPSNIFCLDLVQKYVPDALVIHVIRDGEATIASIVDAAQRYEGWNNRYFKHANSIKRLVALWNRATAISLNYANKSNHLLVSHEALTQDPKAEVQKIAAFVGIPYSDDLLAIDASPYITSGELWKKNMGNTIKPQKSKFTSVFSEDEQDYIRKNLRPIEKFTTKRKAIK